LLKGHQKVTPTHLPSPCDIDLQTCVRRLARQLIIQRAILALSSEPVARPVALFRGRRQRPAESIEGSRQELGNLYWVPPLDVTSMQHEYRFPVLE
jgi:hypothetical protein